MVKRIAPTSSDKFMAAFMMAWPNTTVAFDPASAPGQIQAARQPFAGLGNDTAEAFFSVLAGGGWFGAGDHDRALTEWHNSTELGARSNNKNVEGFALAMLAARARNANHTVQAEQFRNALRRLNERPSFRTFLLIALSGLAEWWASQPSHSEHAARVLGFLEHHDPGGHQSVADVRSRAAGAVPRTTQTTAWLAEGAAMERSDIVNYCLNQLQPAG